MRPEMHDLSQPKKATFAQFDTELSTKAVDNSEQFLRVPLFSHLLTKQAVFPSYPQSKQYFQVIHNFCG